jgi:hypothetical protein
MIWRGEAHHQGDEEVADPQGGRGGAARMQSGRRFRTGLSRYFWPV